MAYAPTPKFTQQQDQPIVIQNRMPKAGDAEFTGTMPGTGGGADTTFRLVGGNQTGSTTPSTTSGTSTNPYPMGYTSGIPQGVDTVSGPGASYNPSTGSGGNKSNQPWSITGSVRPFPGVIEDRYPVDYSPQTQGGNVLGAGGQLRPTGEQSVVGNPAGMQTRTTTGGDQAVYSWSPGDTTRNQNYPPGTATANLDPRAGRYFPLTPGWFQGLQHRGLTGAYGNTPPSPPSSSQGGGGGGLPPFSLGGATPGPGVPNPNLNPVYGGSSTQAPTYPTFDPSNPPTPEALLQMAQDWFSRWQAANTGGGPMAPGGGPEYLGPPAGGFQWYPGDTTRNQDYPPGAVTASLDPRASRYFPLTPGWFQGLQHRGLTGAYQAPPPQRRAGGSRPPWIPEEDPQGPPGGGGESLRKTPPYKDPRR